MTSRSDLPRLFAFLGVLGTEGEQKGQAAWDAAAGWTDGPQPGSKPGERGGGGVDGDEDRQAERARVRSASKRFQAYRVHVAALEKYAYLVMQDMDICVPPNPSEVKNRRTGNLDPITPAEAAVDGLCASCWRNDQHHTPIDVHANGLRYYRDYCRWCGGVKGTYGIEPPMDMLKLHHDDKRIRPEEMEASVKKMLEQAKPKSKGKQKKHKKKGWVAAPAHHPR